MNRKSVPSQLPAAKPETPAPFKELAATANGLYDMLHEQVLALGGFFDFLDYCDGELADGVRRATGQPLWGDEGVLARVHEAQHMDDVAAALTMLRRALIEDSDKLLFRVGELVKRLDALAGEPAKVVA